MQDYICVCVCVCVWVGGEGESSLPTIVWLQYASLPPCSMYAKEAIPPPLEINPKCSPAMCCMHYVCLCIVAKGDPGVPPFPRSTNR